MIGSGLPAPQPLAGRVALVTGAAGRIGRAICLELATWGAIVVASDRDTEGLEEVVRELGGAHTGISGIEADLALTAEARRIVEETARRHGRLDVLVNCAAVLDPGGRVTDCTEEQFELAMAVNVRAPFFAIAAAVPHMLASGGGSIVNVASVLGTVALPGFSSYCVSKGAVVQLTRQVAADFAARGIRCNAVCPGTTAPPDAVDAGEQWAAVRSLHPAGRVGAPEEVARVVRFLASDDASFVHGALLHVDGGYAAL